MRCSYLTCSHKLCNVYLVSEVFLSGVPLQEDGQEGDAGGGDPGQHDHHHRRPNRYQWVVDQWSGNGVISGNVQQSIIRWSCSQLSNQRWCSLKYSQFAPLVSPVNRNADNMKGGDSGDVNLGMNEFYKIEILTINQTLYSQYCTLNTTLVNLWNLRPWHCTCHT